MGKVKKRRPKRGISYKKKNIKKFRSLQHCVDYSNNCRRKSLTQQMNYKYEGRDIDIKKLKMLIWYVRFGNPTLTTFALICLQEFKFEGPLISQIVVERSFIDVVLNLLHSKYVNAQVSALNFLKRLAHTCSTLTDEIRNKEGIKSMLMLLRSDNMLVKYSSASAINAILYIYPSEQTTVAKCKGIPLLINLLAIPKKILCKPLHETIPEEELILSAGTSASRVLILLSQVKSYKRVIQKNGVLDICLEMIKYNHENLIAVLLQLLGNITVKFGELSSSQMKYLLQHVKRHIRSSNLDLKLACMSLVMKIAENSANHHLLAKKGFITIVSQLLKDEVTLQNEDLMAFCTGTLLECSKSYFIIKQLHLLHVDNHLTRIFEFQPLQVKVNVVACLTPCFQYLPSLERFRNLEGIAAFVKALRTQEPALIIHLNKAIAKLFQIPDCRDILDSLDCLRLMWSHLNHSDHNVVASALRNLSAIAKGMPNAGEYFRSLIGSAEVVIQHLHSLHSSVILAACKLIVSLSNEKENIAIFTDNEAIPVLSHLLITEREPYGVCTAIAVLCPYGNNPRNFYNNKIMPSLIKILKKRNLKIKGAACKALCEISVIAKCSSKLRRDPGISEILLKLMQYPDETVQGSAATLLQRIRIFVGI